MWAGTTGAGMMRGIFSDEFLREARATFLLALPLMAGQVSQMLMGVADTLMIGRLGVTPLAASAFANNLLYLPLVFGMGLLTCVSVRVARARGAGVSAEARGAVRHGFYLASLLGCVTMLGALLCAGQMQHFGQDPAVAAMAPQYFLLVAASMIPAFMTIALKNHADAMNRPWPPFWILLAGVLLNVVLNALWIYGKCGFPAWGLEGAGLATLCARVATLLALMWWCARAPALREWSPARWWRRPVWPELAALWRIGLPSGLQLLAEVSAFVMATLVIGALGKEALAAHQVAITCAATVFMVPLGLSMALTVRVGEALGAGEVARLRVLVLSAWALAGVYTVISLAVMLGGRYQIAGWFLTEEPALGMAAGLLLVSAAFQVSDAIQIVAAGGLRGLEDVRVPALVTFVAYWCCALPVGWTLAFPLGVGLYGMWWGITLGLTVTAVVLGRRLWRLSERKIRGEMHRV